MWRQRSIDSSTASLAAEHKGGGGGTAAGTWLKESQWGDEMQLAVHSGRVVVDVCGMGVGWGGDRAAAESHVLMQIHTQTKELSRHQGPMRYGPDLKFGSKHSRGHCLPPSPSNSTTNSQPPAATLPLPQPASPV